jgi:ABC-type multidrug transport system fused ATPase/permease subunit
MPSFNLFLSDTKFEGESLFSFGQRQLFCLARAVLKGSICLVLDEATSNLDSSSELEFLQSSTDAFKGKTIITIAVRIEFFSFFYLSPVELSCRIFIIYFVSFFLLQHRLYSLLDYDRVLIMENGKIIEDGNPRELKSNPNSTFSTMLNASDLSKSK